MAPTPPKPVNTFEQGTGSVQQGKEAINQIIAQQGQYGLQQLQNREQSAGQIAAAAPPVPGRDATTQALYDTFTRDSQQSIAQQGQEMQRIGAANNAYMDQAAGGMALQAKDMDAYYEAMRRAYEDKEKQRQAEMAATNAARRASGGGGGGSSTLNKLSDSVQGANPSTIPFSIAQQLGKKVPNMSKDAARKALGMNDGTIKVLNSKKSDAAHERMVRDVITTARAEDASWDAVLADIRAVVSTPQGRAAYGLPQKSGQATETEFIELVQPLLAMYGGDWGVSPEMWAIGWGAPVQQPAGPRLGAPAAVKRTPTAATAKTVGKLFGRK